MPPGRLTTLARHSIAARLVSARVILYDIYARGAAPAGSCPWRSG
jgi:hypothetical protein